MAVTGIGSSYNSSIYENTYTAKSTETEQTAETGKTAAETIRSTAADELAYLSKKYSGCSFVTGGYQKGTIYGLPNTTNIMIDPRFLEKMTNNSDLEAEYEENITFLQKFDKQFSQMQAARGWKVVANGWAIDKDGGISGWCIVSKDPNAKSYLQKMSENAEKIRRQNEEKKKEKAELAEKRELSKEEQAELKEKLEEIGKEKLGEKFKGMLVLGADDKKSNPCGKERTSQQTGHLAGINVDMKA